MRRIHLTSLIALILLVSLAAYVLPITRKDHATVECGRVGDIVGDNPKGLSMCELPECSAPFGSIVNEPCYSARGKMYY